MAKAFLAKNVLNGQGFAGFDINHFYGLFSISLYLNNTALEEEGNE
jgi:hypothetical protein